MVARANSASALPSFSSASGCAPSMPATLCVTATHCHTAPEVRIGRGGYEEKYLPFALARTMEAVGEALSGMTPGTLRTGMSSEGRCCFNRRFWMRNGSYLRFKTLEIGYRLPYCRIYFSGDNLAVWSPFKYWDPELAYNQYPLSRTFNIGVQFNF